MPFKNRPSFVIQWLRKTLIKDSLSVLVRDSNESPMWLVRKEMDSRCYGLKWVLFILYYIYIYKLLNVYCSAMFMSKCNRSQIINTREIFHSQLHKATKVLTSLHWPTFSSWVKTECLPSQGSLLLQHTIPTLINYQIICIKTFQNLKPMKYFVLFTSIKCWTHLMFNQQ